MKIKFSYGIKSKTRAELIAFACYEGDVNAVSKNIFNQTLKYFGVDIKNITRYGFAGKRDDIFELLIDDSGKMIVILGLGPESDFKPDYARRAGGLLAGLLKKRSIDNGVIAPMPDPKVNIVPFVEGMILGGYEFTQFKSQKSREISAKIMLDESYKPLKKKINVGIVKAEAACFTRDLVNTPANHLTPSAYAALTRKVARQYKIKTRIYSETEIRKMKMGAILGVAQGSAQKPHLITWYYNGAGKTIKPIVLVGKGVMFDTGGISLKPNESMIDMKNDMAGSAAVMAQMIVLGRLKPKLNVIGVVPAVENMPSGTAIKPSDVITASDGQTIEVLNTDAEGRLILADGLCYAKKLKPQAVIDIATLTGAAKIALGTFTAGILGTDKKLLEKLYDAGQATEERTWQLPLWDEYYDQIKSEIADMKNVGGRPAGTITAAAFLSKFIQGVPWAHVDIAAVDNQDSPHPYKTKGATGFGARLLAEFLLNS